MEVSEETKEVMTMSTNDKEDPCKKISNAEPQHQSMSKNQLKKLKKREKWLSVRKQKRKEEKQRKKERIAAKRERGEEIGPTVKKLKLNTMENSSCKIQIVVDLSLDEYMNEKDMKSLTGQLRHCYSDNRRAENPLQLYFCGSSGKTMDRMEEIGDFKRWDVNVNKESYDKVFPKENIVYLTSESSNVLSSLTEGKVYIIGGLVDHNLHKGLCHRLAEEKGIAHAQLPISDYFKMTSRKVLAVNHVFSILLKYTECKDWKEAFLNRMPPRKVADLTELYAGGEKKMENVQEDVQAELKEQTCVEKKDSNEKEDSDEKDSNETEDSNEKESSNEKEDSKERTESKEKDSVDQTNKE